MTPWRRANTLSPSPHWEVASDRAHVLTNGDRDQPSGGKGTVGDRPSSGPARPEDTRQATMMPTRRPAVTRSSVPVRCSDCLQPFDLRDSHRQMATLEGQFALCSDCTWYLQHPGDQRPA
jgi:hypothetical protein